MSVIEGTQVSAYAMADEPSRLLAIHEDTLWAMIHASHEVARNLLYIFSQRVRRSNQVISEGARLAQLYQHYAMMDALTGLHNRRWLDEMLKRQLFVALWIASRWLCY